MSERDALAFQTESRSKFYEDDMKKASFSHESTSKFAIYITHTHTHTLSLSIAPQPHSPMQSPRRRSVDLEAGYAGDDGVTQEMAAFHGGCGVVTESPNPFRRLRVNGFSFRISFCQKRCRYPHAFVFFCCCRVLCLRLLLQDVLRFPKRNPRGKKKSADLMIIKLLQGYMI